jgi:predicted neuraminidase
MPPPPPALALPLRRQRSAPAARSPLAPLAPLAPLQALLLLLLLLSPLLARAAQIPLDGRVRAAADGSLYAYIVPPRGGNHAATVALLPDGSLAAAWFTGGEGTPNCSIAFALLGANSAAWTPGRVVAEHVDFSLQNPVLYVDAALGNLLVLWHTTQVPADGESSSSIWRATSADGGATFSPTRPFYDVPGAFTRNAPVALAGGAVMLPAYNSTPGDIPDYPIYLLSDAAHATWRPVHGPGLDLIQPTVVRLPAMALDGSSGGGGRVGGGDGGGGGRGGGGGGSGSGETFLRAWLRDENQSCAYVSDSHDEGASWSEPAPTPLKNNNAAIQALVLRSGAVAMVFDDETGPGTPRSPLVIALSDDYGASWPVRRALALHDDNATSVGEYSYPALAQDAAGMIHVLFTYDRICIKWVAVSEAWVRAGSGDDTVAAAWGGAATRRRRLR